MHRRDFLRLSAAAPLASATRPNILLILVDDMSWGALSCYGNRHVPTPNLDRLAAEGMRFTDAYVTPQCTPTRATLLTGQYTARNRMWHVIPYYGHPWAQTVEPPFREGLARESVTLAKAMRDAGYRTACIGKWHLTVNADGNYNGLRAEAASAYGFDTVASEPGPREYQTGDKGVDRLTDEALAFMEASPGRPFFCYLAHHTTHGPLSAPAPIVRKYLDKGYPESGRHNATLLACIEHLDHSIGRLLQRMDSAGLTRNTAIFFLTDNGGIQDTFEPVLAAPSPTHLQPGRREFDNAPLRSGKGSAYEGGIRVPFLVRWPGVVRKRSVCRTPVHIVDLFPTFLALAGAPPPANHVLDGADLTPLLKGGKLQDRALYWYMPFYDLRWAATPSAVIREGRFKLILSFGDWIDLDDGARHRLGEHVELYDLRDDLGERKNLAATLPALASRLRAKLESWIRSCGATIPGRNPRFEPARALVESRNRL